MKRMVALILGVKLLLLGISLQLEKPVEIVEAYNDPRPEIQIMTNTEYADYLEQKDIEEGRAEVVEIGVEWSEDSIKQMIRDMFPEDPETAVSVAKCESGFDRDAQSWHTLSYGREQSFGLFQIHAPDWDAIAMELGYTDYKTDVEDNLKMARFIYDDAGGWTPWSCYTKKMI